MEVFLNRALYFSLCLTLVESTANYQLFKGPRTGETQRYQVCPMPSQQCSHCFYCKDGVLSDSSYANEQDVLCNQYYRHKNMSEALLPEEFANNKIPVCNVGQVPGCGSPPEDNSESGLYWYCDIDYSNQPHSVYFSCALICNYTNTVAYQYYCNESLRWELLEAATSSCRSNVSEEVLTSIEAGTASMVLPMVGIVAGVMVVAVAVICSIRCFIFHRRKKEDERVRNGELAQIKMSVMNGNDSIHAALQDEHETDLKTLDHSEIGGQDKSAKMSLLTGKINNVTYKDKPASKCTVNKCFNGSKHHQSRMQVDDQTDVKTLDPSKNSGPEACASFSPLTGKIDNNTTKGKPASKCTWSKTFKRTNSEPTSCIKIHFKIVNGKLKWEKCQDVNGVFEIPSVAEEIRISINPQKANGLRVIMEDRPIIKGEYQVGEMQYVIDSKEIDCSGKYCCKYKLLPSKEEKTERFELKHLMKKVNNDINQPADKSYYALLNLESLVSKESGLSSIKGAKCISSYTSPKSTSDPCKSWKTLSGPNSLESAEVEDEKIPCLTNS
ncbi:uncharacterized protein LOC127879168 isoform X2 [Dreissena polymorpha]|uniref:Uncharacterized protein n=3 Tax=Dreissena polymorpha TaxID=45954 RepID=A0A9D4QKF1_DREPO|nr:uncharacterized protein LOC127879168 isoform X2 [Dreissena polymorpha]KAH3833670.1 hypothetical protein DPMN_106983 [Dreissena polymorpha]